MESIVLYPAPGMGHLISMVELGKLILNLYPSFSITILITTAPFNTGATAQYISRVSSTTSSITFHHLPTTISLLPNSNPSILTLTFDLIRLNNPNIHHAVQSLSHTCTIRAIIVDGFCGAVLPVTAELDIPTYSFFTSGAGCLACFLYLPTIHRNTTKSLKDLNTLLDIPSLPPIPSSDMAKPILDRSTKEYEFFLSSSTHLTKYAGIVVNTFESLESKAVKAISDGLCVPDCPTPPIFCIGPLIANDDKNGGGGGGSECLTWLDSQPSRSVVFLSFGSFGAFTLEQLKEIALGLERSGQRFLWVVRNPPSEENEKRFLAQPDPDLDSLLPQGFLDRTKERGLVVKEWAPQVAVLNHHSVGGFVTHCGWNSVLEAVHGGVPMVAWPLYAEQRFNRVLLVEEMKLALSMDESRDGFVSAAELEKRVRELMDSEEGKSMRERAMAAREEAMLALSEGGSTRIALAKLVESWKLAG